MPADPGFTRGLERSGSKSQKKLLVGRTETRASVFPDELDQIVVAVESKVFVIRILYVVNCLADELNRIGGRRVYVVAQIGVLFAILRVPGIDVGIGDRFR